jgi:hypothetical protein
MAVDDVGPGLEQRGVNPITGVKVIVLPHEADCPVIVNGRGPDGKPREARP